MENKNLDVLLNGTNRVNNNIENAMQKLANLIKVEEDDRLLRDILNDLMSSQLELVSLNKGIVEIVEPNNKDYLMAVSSNANLVKERQNKIEAEIGSTLTNDEEMIR